MAMEVSRRSSEPAREAPWCLHCRRYDNLYEDWRPNQTNLGTPSNNLKSLASLTVDTLTMHQWSVKTARNRYR